MSAAAVYARAIFEIANEKGDAPAILAELKEFSSALFADRTVEIALCRGLLDAKSRKEVMALAVSKAGVSDLVGKFLILLAERRRLGELKEILTELQSLINGRAGVLVGSLRAAVELNQDQLGGLVASLSKRLGKKVELRQSVDPDLIGGFIARVGGRTFDSSLQTQLQRLKTQLSQ